MGCKIKWSAQSLLAWRSAGQKQTLRVSGAQPGHGQAAAQAVLLFLLHTLQQLCHCTIDAVWPCLYQLLQKKKTFFWKVYTPYI